MPLGRPFIRKKADNLVNVPGIDKPVDLYRLAEYRRVRSIEVRPLTSEGGVNAVPGGFEIFIQGPSFYKLELPGDPDISSSSASRRALPLTRRQRFTLAHELAHTLFFDTSSDTPHTVKGSPKGGLLEYCCHYGARRILMPDRLLVPLLVRERKLTADLVLDLCTKFCVSAEVAIRRLDDLSENKIKGSAIILGEFDENYNDAIILGVCSDESLLCHLPRPALYTSLKLWCGPILGTDFWAATSYQRYLVRPSGKFVLTKTPYPENLHRFFLELNFAVL